MAYGGECRVWANLLFRLESGAGKSAHKKEIIQCLVF